MFILFIADICLWWLLFEIAKLGETLLTISGFAMAIFVFLWVVLELWTMTLESMRTESDQE